MSTPAGPASLPPAPAPAPSERDQVYDRQMRRWGAAAQQRLSASRVLVTGEALRGVGAELVKDLVLAGLNLALRDAAPAAREDALTSVFLRAEDAGRPLSLIHI